MLFKISLLLPLLFVCLFSTNVFALSNTVNNKVIIRNTVIGVIPNTKVYTHRRVKANILVKSGKFKGCSIKGLAYMSAVSQRVLISFNKVNCSSGLHTINGFALFPRKADGLKVTNIKKIKSKSGLELSGIVKKQNINLIILN
jgi:hypothetical protein